VLFAAMLCFLVLLTQLPHPFAQRNGLNTAPNEAIANRGANDAKDGDKNSFGPKLPAQSGSVDLLQVNANRSMIAHARGLHVIRRLLLGEFPSGDLEEILFLDELEDLYISNNDYTDEDFRWISKVKSLKRLTLGCPALEDGAAIAISKLSSLESLTMTGTITDDGLRAIGRLRALKKLSVFARCSSDGFRALKALDKLQVLVIRGGSVSDEAMTSVLSHMPDLRYLQTNLVGVSDEGIARVIQQTRLETLILYSCPTGMETWKAVQSNTSLRNLGVDRFRLDPTMERAIRNQRPSLAIRAD
jgi:hypothetical protein